jgi:hypothetical protein
MANGGCVSKHLHHGKSACPYDCTAKLRAKRTHSANVGTGFAIRNAQLLELSTLLPQTGFHFAENAPGGKIND